MSRLLWLCRNFTSLFIESGIFRVECWKCADLLESKKKKVVKKNKHHWHLFRESCQVNGPYSSVCVNKPFIFSCFVWKFIVNCHTFFLMYLKTVKETIQNMLHLGKKTLHWRKIKTLDICLNIVVIMFGDVSTILHSIFI